MSVLSTTFHKGWRGLAEYSQLASSIPGALAYLEEQPPMSQSMQRAVNESCGTEASFPSRTEWEVLIELPGEVTVSFSRQSRSRALRDLKAAEKMIAEGRLAEEIAVRPVMYPDMQSIALEAAVDSREAGKLLVYAEAQTTQEALSLIRRALPKAHL